jgi:hypothetical protein
MWQIEDILSMFELNLNQLLEFKSFNFPYKNIKTKKLEEIF